ncbi:MAG: ribonuclease J [Tissierellia bacterium]|nr:ribonuclease J [Tissierellia bacterium]
MRKQTKLKMMPLGGLREIGKNITAFEYEDDIVVIDCGMTFPEEEMLGVDIVIPDMTYLEQNKDKIKGIFLTHGHEDHIGAIPYLLKNINPKIYGTKLTLGLLENKLKEKGLLKSAKLKQVNAGQTVEAGNFNVEFIRSSHSIPDSVFLAVHSPVGTVLHTGDFKIDYTPIDGQVLNLNRIGQLGNQGILLLMSDSTNAVRPGYAMSERTVGKTFETIFSSHDARIIVATFASNLHRVQQIITASENHKRKIVVSGRSMENNVKVAMDLGYLKIKPNTLVDINDMNNYRKDEITIITTGSQGEPMAALSRMAAGEHRKIKLLADDLVVISASPIPGNEVTISRVIDNLVERGTNVVYEALADVHVSGHACQEELKLILTLAKPKFFMPMHGEFRHLRAHAELAKDVGMKESNILLAKNGDVIELTKNSAVIAGSVASGNVLVDGYGIGDVGNIVLRDRKHLSEDGLIIVAMTMSRENKNILSGPDIISRGFVYVRESEDLMKEARDVADEIITDLQDDKVKDWSVYKAKIRDGMRKFIFEKMGRDPMILPIIMEV